MLIVAIVTRLSVAKFANVAIKFMLPSSKKSRNLMQPLSDAAVYGAQLPLEPWPLHPHLYECVLIVQWHKMEKW